MKPLLHQSRQLWERFWFAPDSAQNLAAARLVTAITALWVLLSRDFPAMSGTPLEFWSFVAWTTRWRYLLFPGHETLERLLQGIALIALIGVLLGIWTRLCCFAASLLLYHLAPLESIFWTTSPYIRGLGIPVLALMALALAPCGDTWCLWHQRNRPLTPSWAYHWPVRFIQVQISYIYFFSAYSKIVDVGWHWATAENMQAWLLALNQGLDAQPFQHPGLWLAAHPLLCQLSGILALLLEFGFIIVLFSTRLRFVLLPIALLFHVGIWLTMNITVLYLPFFLVFVNWATVCTYFTSPDHATQRPVC